ncbi:MAG: PcfJ domain-containing protein [Ruminococcus sp.]|nr:PcfJ domain-containing protein [Ruminococcus sp.]
MNDSEFEGMPKLTEEQLSEINDLFPHYLFYRRTKANTAGIAGTNCKKEVSECVCSRCGSEFILERGLVHNIQTTCTKCGRIVTAKHKSYGKQKLNQWIRVLAICPEREDRVWLRAFLCYKAYQAEGKEKLTPEIRKAEEARYLLEPRKKARYWRWNYKGGKFIWCEQKNPQEPFHSYMGYGGEYYLLSQSRLSDTFLRYIDFRSWYAEYQEYYNCYLSHLCYSVLNVPNTRYMCEFAQYPIFESLIKAGFGELVAGKIAERRVLSTYLNWEADKLSDFFKSFDKKEVKWLHDCDYQYISLKEYALFKQVYGKKDIERYQSDKEIFGMCFTELLQLIRRYKLRYTHSLNYLIAQSDKYRPTDRIKIRNEWSMLNIWTDYLRFAKELGYDMKNEIITHPKELMQAHNKAAKTVAAIQRKQAEEKAKVINAENKEKYAFEYAGLRIVIPTCPDDIIREGEKLHHCVGGYSDRHFSGKLTILFIRKITKPEKPYVTMEVRGKKIVQVHGYRNDINKPLPKSVKLFVEEFKKYIEQPIKYKKELEKEKARKTA